MPQKTLVFQSHRQNLPYAWLTECFDSVKQWAHLKNYDYIFIDDALFSVINKEIFERYKSQKVILTDIARLLWARKYLNDGYERVIWLDADFLIFNAEEFNLLKADYAVGREVWVQKDKAKGLSVYKKVHNAFLMFSKDNAFLDFYIETAMRLLSTNTGNVPPQFIGPKLLTALHNICLLPVQESAGMLSPIVLNDLSSGQGQALDLFEKSLSSPVYAANISTSVIDEAGLSDDEMLLLFKTLHARKGLLAQQSLKN